MKSHNRINACVVHRITVELFALVNNWNLPLLTDLLISCVANVEFAFIDHRNRIIHPMYLLYYDETKHYVIASGIYIIK